MKKIFAVLTIATVFVACGGGEQAPAAAETPVAPAVDSTKKDTTAPVAAPAPAEAKKH